MLVKNKLVEVCVFLSANFRWKGTSPTNVFLYQKTRLSTFFRFVTKHKCVGRMDGQNYDPQLSAPQSGTHSRISSGTRPSVWTVSDGCLKLICSLDTSAFSALEVLTTTVLYKFTYLLTYFTDSISLFICDILTSTLAQRISSFLSISLSS